MNFLTAFTGAGLVFIGVFLFVYTALESRFIDKEVS